METPDWDLCRSRDGSPRFEEAHQELALLVLAERLEVDEASIRYVPEYVPGSRPISSGIGALLSVISGALLRGGSIKLSHQLERAALCGHSQEEGYDGSSQHENAANEIAHKDPLAAAGLYQRTE